MKTHEDNKCGMECIRTNAERICVKPEKGQCPRCEQIVEESLVHIHRLESTYSQVSKALCSKENATLDELLTAVNQLKSRLAQVEKERDAAVLSLHGQCEECAWDQTMTGKCIGCMHNETEFMPGIDNWEWRGVCAENSKEESM